ncbi:MAG: hypothetical protein HUJ92_03320 [Bacteroidales bacterium]|nr:hypothetical protein [Bacteroidales bacterium]
MKAIKKIFFSSICLVLLMGLSGCGSTFICSVSSFGTTPLKKSYYVIPADSTLTDDLAFNEYANHLKKRLNESGYNETNPDKADLCIVLAYFMGEEKYVGTTETSSTSSYSETKGKVSSTTHETVKERDFDFVSLLNAFTSTETKAKAETRSYSNRKTAYKAQYQTPIGVAILAVDCYTKKPTWKVEINDVISSESPTTFRAVMPWLLTCAQPYFGTNYEGRPTITQEKGQKMGLVWPYPDSL